MNNINSAIANINKSHKMLNKIEEKLKNKIVFKPIIQVYVDKKTPVKKRKVVTKTPAKREKKEGSEKNLRKRKKRR